MNYLGRLCKGNRDLAARPMADRFELQKNEFKQLKRLSRAQNCAPRSLKIFGRVEAMPRPSGGPAGTLAIPSAAVFSSLFAS